MNLSASSLFPFRLIITNSTYAKLAVFSDRCSRNLKNYRLLRTFQKAYWISTEHFYMDLYNSKGKETNKERLLNVNSEQMWGIEIELILVRSSVNILPVLPGVVGS